MIYVLYNPLANNGRGETSARALDQRFSDTIPIYLDFISLDLAAFFKTLPAADMVILAGGDGTLNHFVNRLGGEIPAHEVYYYPAGSGNDFMRDAQSAAKNSLVLLNPYLQNLPRVTVGGKTRFFLNGVGYGIDGFCCEEGDRQRETSDKPVNYTAIAIRGLLGGFHPVRATVTVDGLTRAYRHVWLAPAMNGRYYGGGMNVAPAQDRLSADGTVSVVVLHCASKLATLCVFPSIFKGEHVNHTKMVDVLTGRDVSVSFDRPTALQIDGETVPNATGYSVQAGARRTANVEKKAG